LPIEQAFLACDFVLSGAGLIGHKEVVVEAEQLLDIDRSLDAERALHDFDVLILPDLGGLHELNNAMDVPI